MNVSFAVWMRWGGPPAKQVSKLSFVVFAMMLKPVRKPTHFIRENKHEIPSRSLDALGRTPKQKVSRKNIWFLLMLLELFKNMTQAAWTRRDDVPLAFWTCWGGSPDRKCLEETSWCCLKCACFPVHRVNGSIALH